ncbi:uncharacterized protein LOC133184167 [Saccostrea echinata]|uniref:uncharacterized protein LOC133184167 n=1 Tax=Saccostrea echinata TaxID=191078 RepID=UPI002A81135C|nr:uncharacterized protein LOC133184167 [Saccostrea echinata]
MMQFQLCCMFFFMSIVACSPVQQIEHLNATFPCGKLSDEQKCKIPFEYCDVILESCQSCNEDICREESQQSCNIYCSDFQTKINEPHVQTESHISLYKTPFYGLSP